MFHFSNSSSTILFPLPLQYLLLDSGRLHIPPLRQIGQGQRVHGRQRVRVSLTQDRPPFPENLLLDPDRLCVPSLRPIGQGQSMHGHQCSLHRIALCFSAPPPGSSLQYLRQINKAKYYTKCIYVCP